MKSSTVLVNTNQPDLYPESVIALEQALHNIRQEMIPFEAMTTKSCLELGKRWKTIRDKKLWNGHKYCHSMREYSENETGYTYATVSKYIAVYDKFGPVIENNPEYYHAEHSRLIKALRYVNESNAQDWLVRAAHLSKKDFNNYIREAKGKLAPDKCCHPKVEREVWERCKACNGWLKKYSVCDRFDLLPATASVR